MSACADAPRRAAPLQTPADAGPRPRL